MLVVAVDDIIEVLTVVVDDIVEVLITVIIVSVTAIVVLVVASVLINNATTIEATTMPKRIPANIDTTAHTREHEQQ